MSRDQPDVDPLGVREFLLERYGEALVRDLLRAKVHPGTLGPGVRLTTVAVHLLIRPLREEPVAPSRGEPLPDGPIVLAHLEAPPGSGLAACCAQPFSPPAGRWPDVPRMLCPGCYGGVRK